MLTEKDCEDLIEKLYPYFIKKFKQEDGFQRTMLQMTAEVVESRGAEVDVKLNPYDTETITVKNPNGISVVPEEAVYIAYAGNIRNAYITRKPGV